MAVVFDIVNMADKAKADTLTDADWVQLTGDIMQMGSGLGNGVPKLVEQFQFWQKTRASPLMTAVANVQDEASLADFGTRLNTAIAGGTAEREAFIMDSTEFESVLGLEGLQGEEVAMTATAQFERMIGGLEAAGIDTADNAAVNSFLQSTYHYSKNTGRFGVFGTDIEHTIEQTANVLAAGDTGVEGAAAFAARAAGTEANNSAIAQGRATKWLTEMWEGETAGSSAAGISAEAMGFVSLASRAIGAAGSAANFFYAGVEVDKAVNEAAEDHPLLASLHGIMAVDFAVIGASSLLGSGAAAGLFGNAAYAAVASATAGWGVAALLLLQTAVAVAEELERDAERNLIEDDAEAASTGEVARDEGYYYTRTSVDEWDPDMSN